MFFFQADNAHWPVFGRLSKSLGLPIVPPKADTPKYEAKIYKGFDSHSQVGLARHIITQELPKGAEVRNKTLILLSDPNNLIPLLSELVSELDEFNVSLGYPLQRSSL